MAVHDTKWREPLAANAKAERGRIACCFLLVFAGFTLTSTSYLAWVYHLMDFVEPTAADGLSMIGGYTFQAIGVGTAMYVGMRRPGLFARMPFFTLVALHFACAMPAIFSPSFPATVAFGFLMGLLCGGIAGNYLHRLATDVPEGKRGIVFGCGYACSVLASWFLSLAQNTWDSGGVTIVACIVFSVGAIAVAFVENTLPARGDEQEAINTSTLDAPKIILLACIAVLLMSLVKGIGFGFPSADISSGVNLELSRLAYAVGLVIAGIVVDRNRKYGMLCCIAALVTPFVLMVLAREPIPSVALWLLDYFFFGFFSVFRVVLFADIAARYGKTYLAGFGLMFGRIGDALGVAIYLSLGPNAIMLVTVGGVLFVATLFVFYRLLQELFPAAPVTVRDEQAIFEEFAARHELSSREREVLRLLLSEHSNSEIAGALFVSESTVKFHVRNLLKKTGCKNRLELRTTYHESR